MLIEDHRNISCGGDPFNYIKSVFKGLSFQLEPGQEALVMVMREKFPYGQGTFESLARTTKLKLKEMTEKDGELSLFLVRSQN
ncbi:MAG TPA: hypothetical protein VKU79_01020 [Thermoplasmataceae archaeon]|nr:hypothetical protein [Thermoplasmatales archaeon AK]HLH85430.1 hypothetical protein [Thermoplasmataceae archaeon]